jgi:hypothetical protein
MSWRATSGACAARVLKRLRSSELASPTEWRYVLNLLEYKLA